MTAHRRIIAVALAGAVAVGAAVLLGAPPAQAASEYRWWGYWFTASGASSWTYAGVGPAGHRVDDGSVEGWRFAVAVPNPTAPPPRTSAATTFDRVCGGVDRPEGQDRVALVVDFGTTTDAPPGQHPPTSTVRVSCVLVPDRSNGLAVLSGAGYAVATGDSGLVCSLQGYPRGECGVVVKASPSPTPTRSSKPTRTADPDRTRPADPTATSSAPGSPSRGTASASPATTGGAGASGSASPVASGEPTDPASSTPPALAAGPPPADGAGGGGPGGAWGLLAGVALVAGLAAVAVRRGRSKGGPA